MMSGPHFHVHGPHDHELDHAAQGVHRDPFAGRIAVTTAILATVAALFSYQSTASQASSMRHMNRAAMIKTEAESRWDRYQITSNRQHLAELGALLVTADKAEAFRAEVQRYKQEMADDRSAAEQLEIEAKSWDRRSDEDLHLHHRWAQATTALQIAIAMAAILLLTRRPWLQYAMYGLAGLGGLLGLLAVLQI